MITKETYDSFIFLNENGKIEVIDPTDFDKSIGEFETRELAEAAFMKSLEDNQIEFDF